MLLIRHLIYGMHVEFRLQQLFNDYYTTVLLHGIRRFLAAGAKDEKGYKALTRILNILQLAVLRTTVVFWIGYDSYGCSGLGTDQHGITETLTTTRGMRR